MHLTDRKPSIHEKVTTPGILLKPKYDAKAVFLQWKGRLSIEDIVQTLEDPLVSRGPLREALNNYSIGSD
jgi:hypothetical protein